jgi:hypothetical protein
LGRLLAVFAVLLLAGCAVNPAAQEQKVLDRAQARWDAVIAGDLESAYTYYSPGYRSATSVIDFAVEMRTRRVRYTSAKYVSHECGEARCTVKFLVGFRIPAPVPGMTVFDSTQLIEDTWVRTDGKWWYLPNN